ncbi:hypothetical protein DID77_04030 [Candidatus Marinamargulisbacteria bacterium SCGC AG-439-L15]|nr:hypothetical protein DID77_04030 [Candidatus Marinamargulisbacteria bacterium SCGC AG-439-L15]
MEQSLILTKKDESKLLSSINKPRDKAMFLLMLESGLRLNEVSTLPENAIDLDKKTCHVPGKNQRTLKLQKPVINALDAWVQSRPENNTKHFFTTLVSNPNKISDRTVEQAIKNYAEKAKVGKTINARFLRNTFAVRLFLKGKSNKDVKNMLGIQDSKTISKYKKQAQEIQEDQEIARKESVPETPKNKQIWLKASLGASVILNISALFYIWYYW